MTPAANAVFKVMRQAILSDPCLQRYDHCKLLVLLTNFSADGFGHVACQPANNKISLATMKRCMHGKGFKFMTKMSAAVLHPIAFGCRHTRGNETRLHSHLGEEFTRDWAINKTSYVFRSTLYVGHRLLCNKICPVICRAQSLHLVLANAANVLGHGHRAQNQHLPDGRGLLVTSGY
jgi:hypothetical protein